jgi:chromosome segregation ATPase
MVLMSFRSQSSPRGASRHSSKGTREKKTKTKKQKTTAKYLQEETPQATPQEIAEKTINCLNKLGNQIFALSPFSQYFDDWLVMLKRTLNEFEAHPNITLDAQYKKETTQALLDVEAALAENRLQEAEVSKEAQALADNNHAIVEADREYAEQTRTLSNKRNSEVQQLSNHIRELEDDLALQQDIKIGFFKFKEKRLAAERLAKTSQDLNDAKTELEVKLQSFTAEQEKLHDNYMKRKQELNEISDRLHKELEKLETDNSAVPRQAACNALVESINGLLGRTPPPSA